MRAIATVLVCLACCGHGRRVQNATYQNQDSLHKNHQNSEGDGSIVSRTHAHMSLNQSTAALGVPLKSFVIALLASLNPAGAEARMPGFKRSLAEPRSKTHHLTENKAWRHLADPRFEPRFSHKDDSDIGKLAALGGLPSYLKVPRRLVARSRGAIIPRIKGLSFLTARTKDIYDLESGEILFLSKSDSDSESLQTENDVLQAVQQAGVSVVPHKLIKTINPRTGNVVKGMIQTRIHGTFVNFQEEEDSPEKLVLSLGLNVFKAKGIVINKRRKYQTAVINLKDDLTRIKSAIESGLRIGDLQGIMQPDGHFFLIDPLGITLPRGEYITTIPNITTEPRRHVQEGMTKIKRTIRYLESLHVATPDVDDAALDDQAGVHAAAASQWWPLVQ